MAQCCRCFCCRALCCRNDIGAVAAVGVVEEVGGSGSHSVCVGLYGADVCDLCRPVWRDKRVRLFWRGDTSFERSDFGEECLFAAGGRRESAAGFQSGEFRWDRLLKGVGK